MCSAYSTAGNGEMIARKKHWLLVFQFLSFVRKVCTGHSTWPRKLPRRFGHGWVDSRAAPIYRDSPVSVWPYVGADLRTL